MPSQSWTLTNLFHAVQYPESTKAKLPNRPLGEGPEPISLEQQGAPRSTPKAGRHCFPFLRLAQLKGQVCSLSMLCQQHSRQGVEALLFRF